MKKKKQQSLDEDKKEKKEKKKAKKKKSAEEGKKNKTGKKKLSLPIKNKKVLLILLLLLVAIAAAAVFFLHGKGGGEDTPEESVPEEPEPLPVVDAPIQYEIKDLASVIAFPVGESIVVTEEVPEEKEEKKEEKKEVSSEDGSSSEDSSATSSSSVDSSEAEEEPEEDPTTVLVTYHYQGLKEPLERLSAYCDLLTTEDFGFVPVDEKRMKTKLKSVEGESGNIQLVRLIESESTSDESEESLLSLTIGWEPEECYVTVAQIDGGIVQPPKRDPLTLSEAIDYFYNQNPAVLGLSGESMREYQVYAMDGAVLVDGISCMRMNVYKKDPNTGTNTIAGQYLMSGDGTYLYFVDNDGVVHSLDE